MYSVKSCVSSTITEISCVDILKLNGSPKVVPTDNPILEK